MVSIVPEPLFKEMNNLESMLARYKRAESIKEIYIFADVPKGSHGCNTVGF